MSYRLVYNRIEELLFISSTTNGNDAVLNNKAGNLLTEISKKLEKFDYYKSIYFKFLEDCIDYGWIQTNGNINGSFTVIEQSPHLKRAQIELTRFCNLKCSYCYSESGSHQKTRYTTEKIFSLLDELEKLGCVWVDFTGGEPFLFGDWFEIFKYTNQKSILLSIHSNGTVINEKTLSKISQLKVKQFQFSLDSHIPEIHDSVRGQRGAFAKTIESIKRVKELGVNVKVSIAAHKLNKETYKDSVSWIRNQLGVNVLLDRIIKAGYEMKSELGLEMHDYYNVISPLLGKETFTSKLCSNEILQDSGIIEPSCGIAHSFVYITADGEVALCPTMTSRENKIFSGPSVFIDSLSEIWYNSEYFNSYRFLNCRNIKVCPKAKECTGGCRSNAYIESGGIDSPDIISCNIHKNNSLKFIEFKYP